MKRLVIFMLIFVPMIVSAQRVLMIGADGHVRWRHLDSMLQGFPNGGRAICGIGQQRVWGNTSTSTNMTVGGNPIATMNGSKIQTWIPQTLVSSLTVAKPVFVSSTSTTVTLDMGEMPDILRYARSQNRLSTDLTWSYQNNYSRIVVITGLTPATAYRCRNRWALDAAYMTSLSAETVYSTAP